MGKYPKYYHEKYFITKEMDVSIVEWHVYQLETVDLGNQIAYRTDNLLAKFYTRKHARLFKKALELELCHE